MEFSEVVEGRRSIRTFLDEPIPIEDIEKIIRLGTYAPSAGNSQNWRFMAILNQQLKNQMKNVVKNKLYWIAQKAGEPNPENYLERKNSFFFAEAPLALAVLTQHNVGKITQLLHQCGFAEAETDYLNMRPDLQTIGGLIQTILLAAYSYGYGGCWMTGPNIARHELEDLLSIDASWSLAAIIALGRPANTLINKKIKPLAKILQIVS